MVSRSVHLAVSRVFGDELSEILDIVLAGEIVSDRALAERLVRAVGALAHLHGRHPLDTRGRCAWCWAVPRRWWRPWPKRSTCTVHAALNFFLQQPADLVRAASPNPSRLRPLRHAGRSGGTD